MSGVKSPDSCRLVSCPGPQGDPAAPAHLPRLHEAAGTPAGRSTPKVPPASADHLVHRLPDLNDLTAMGELHQLDLGTGSAQFRPTVEAPTPPGVRHLQRSATCTPGSPTSTSPPTCASPVSSTEIVFRGRCPGVPGGRPHRHGPDEPPTQFLTKARSPWLIWKAPRPTGDLKEAFAGEPGQPPLPVLRPEGRDVGLPAVPFRLVPRGETGHRSATSTSSRRGR